MTNALERLGLSPSERKIYIHLFKHGPSYANSISGQTGINRTNVYEAMARLLTKGLISYIVRNKVKWYQARSPDSLLSLVKKAEEDLIKTRKALKIEIGSLKKFPLPERSLEASIFVGKKGLRMLFDNIISAGKPIRLIASELQFKKVFGPYFELWHRQRIKKGIRQKSIFPKRFEGKVKRRKLLEYRFVDDRFTNPTTTIIYGDSCLFIQWSGQPLAIRISDKNITRTHKNYFDMLWGSHFFPK
ncbi:MAG: hypothetical protein KJ709_08120 [Nanoarchaeota archaeon]|nr:hypothetical protein [Nanoarchaeota archaeon]